jgi:hypothetical protein
VIWRLILRYQLQFEEDDDFDSAPGSGHHSRNSSLSAVNLTSLSAAIAHEAAAAAATSGHVHDSANGAPAVATTVQAASTSTTTGGPASGSLRAGGGRKRTKISPKQRLLEWVSLTIQPYGLPAVTNFTTSFQVPTL